MKRSNLGSSVLQLSQHACLAVILRHCCQTRKPLATLLPCYPYNESKSGAVVTDELELRVWKLVTGHVTQSCEDAFRSSVLKKNICVYNVKVRQRHCIKVAKSRRSQSKLNCAFDKIVK